MSNPNQNKEERKIKIDVSETKPRPITTATSRRTVYVNNTKNDSQPSHSILKNAKPASVAS